MFLAGTAPVGAVEKKELAPLCVWLCGRACAVGGDSESQAPVARTQAAFGHHKPQPEHRTSQHTRNRRAGVVQMGGLRIDFGPRRRWEHVLTTCCAPGAQRLSPILWHLRCDMGIGGCAGTYGKVPDTRPKAGDANGASPGSDQEALTDLVHIDYLTYNGTSDAIWASEVASIHMKYITAKGQGLAVCVGRARAPTGRVWQTRCRSVQAMHSRPEQRRSLGFTILIDLFGHDARRGQNRETRPARLFGPLEHEASRSWKRTNKTWHAHADTWTASFMSSTLHCKAACTG